MKDPLLTKLMKSYRFRRLPKKEQQVELHDYAFQKRNIKPFVKQ